MSKKRRVFDIDIPEGDFEETFPAGKVEAPLEESKRRGPMATAITETAGSLRERQEIEATIRAENDALAHEHVRLKKLGLIVDMIPLDKIDTHKLVRDRRKGPDFEIIELKASIKDIGLSNPIRVEPRADGRFELIQGYRRWTAFKELLEETGDEAKFGSIPAGIIAQGESVETLYRKMVDENLVRKDISFAEMAKLAVDYAKDPTTAETDPDKAVAALFSSAGYQKRSYIRGFIPLVEALDGILKFPQEIPRRLGLALSKRLTEVEGLRSAIRSDLEGWDNYSVRDELDVLRKYAEETEDDFGMPVTKKADKVPSAAPTKAKTTFQIERPHGVAKCTAGNGRLEIRLERDFSTIDRRKLEEAVRAMLNQIE